MALTLSMPVLSKREGRTVPRSQAERLWLLGGGLIALVMLLIGYFFFISPQRSTTSDVQSQVNAAQAQNTSLEAHIAALQAQNRNLPKYLAELKAAQLALPAGNGVADFVRTLQSLGNATQTAVTTLSAGAAAPVAAPAASSTAGTSGTSTANSTPSATSGLVSYALSVQVTGSPAALNKFLEQLQAVQPRAVLITQVTESSGTAAGTAAGAHAATGGTSLQLSMQAFGTAPAAPAPSTAPH